MAVNGRPIAQPDFDALVSGAIEDVRAVMREEPALSHFEVVTALALQHFHRQQARCSQAPKPLLGRQTLGHSEWVRRRGWR